MYLEATGEVYRGESALFRAPRRRDLTYVGRLRAYRDLSESTEYVLNQVIDTVLARDKEFVKWRESHSGSYVPRTKDRPGRKNIGPRRHQTSVVSSGESATAVDR